MKTLQSLLAAGLLAFGVCPFQTQAGPRINPLFFGQNAWMPLQIGAEFVNGDLETLLCGASYTTPTDVCVPAEVKESGVKLMRYGGSTVDKNYCDPPPANPALCGLHKDQYLTMVRNMRTNGIEPLLQVPYFDGRFNEIQAQELISYINITNNQDVIYWTIGNEPDNYVDQFPSPPRKSPVTLNGLP